MNKNAKVILNILIIILLGLIIFLVIRNNMTQGKLNKEINEIYNLINEKNYDYNEIYNRLNEVKTKNGYAIVEISAKKYLFDYFDKILDINTIMSSKNNDYFLSTENIKNDMPKFEKTKEDIKKNKNDILNLKSDILLDLELKTMMNYIVDENLEDSYLILYQNLEFAKEENIEKRKKEINQVIENYVERLEITEQIINILEANPNSWKIKDDKIVFTDDKLAKQYNDLIIKLS